MSAQATTQRWKLKDNYFMEPGRHRFMVSKDGSGETKELFIEVDANGYFDVSPADWIAARVPLGVFAKLERRKS